MEKKQLTVKELADQLNGLVIEGKGEVPIWFDTEARHFHYHMAKVGGAYYEPDATVGEAMFYFTELNEEGVASHDNCIDIKKSGELIDALLKADRYFKADAGENACDPGLSKQSAAYAVDQVLKKMGYE